ncbi:MAG: hypothetical protein ACRC6A_06055 [Fusobacteriaceae bacterium]
MFKLGLFLIPFENFFFAPSAGWGAIAPIVFFFYVIYNFEYIESCIKDSEKILLIYGAFIILSLINYYFFGVVIKNVFDNIMTLTLGLFYYYALYIRYVIKKVNFFRDIRTLYLGYAVSLGVGIFQYIVYNLNISVLIKIMGKLSKRFYYPRIQFTFTEPSFIPIHIFGFLLIIFIFLYKNNIKISKNAKILFCAYVIIANLISSSGRMALDTFIIFGIVISSYFLEKKEITEKIIILFFCVAIVVGLVSKKDYINKNIIAGINPRMSKIIDEGIYYDASLASRYFRINASIKGYKKNIEALSFGNGMGNLYIYLGEGYNEAKKEYKNSYLYEVIGLKNSKTKTLFSMPIKLISEYGLIMFIAIICALFSKKYFDVYIIMMYLYIQFDSYALYTVWIYIFLRKYIYELKRNVEIKSQIKKRGKKYEKKSSINNRNNRTRRIILGRISS